MYSHKSIALSLLFGWGLLMTQAVVAKDGTEKIEQSQLRVHVVFNNVPYKEGLETSWGFSCLIEGLDKTVLFDTGGNGDILLSNMQRLGLAPEAVDAVVLSHIHGDHTGGLAPFWRKIPMSLSLCLNRFRPHSSKRLNTSGRQLKPCLDLGRSWIACIPLERWARPSRSKP